MKGMRHGVLRVRVAWVLLAGVALAGGFLYMGRHTASPQAPPAPTTRAPRRTLVLATTTSVQDSGLLDELLPRFEQATGCVVRVQAVGSGKALQLARLGEVDAVLCHSPRAEEAFVRDGLAESRRHVASNAYVIVGPASDPAGVRQARTAGEALSRIVRSEAPFVSRGDGSGTHQKEQELWKAAGVQPRGSWYTLAGAGMGATLKRADAHPAYTLTDAATFATYRPRLKLTVLHQGGAALENPYSFLVVRGARPAAGADAARQLSDFLTGPEGQSVIARYGTDRFGQPLFQPASQ